MAVLFGTDGIRGKANQYPMDASMAFSVGQAITWTLKQEGLPARIIIGKDTRISGYMIESALVAGITSMGGTPYLVGVLPTAGIAFMTESMRADAGIVISASHNPFEDNGIKVFSGNGFKLTDEQEVTIETLILSRQLPKMVPTARDMGQAYRIHDADGRYIVFLKNTFPRELSLNGIKIAMDTSNGAAYRIAPDVFTELGADISIIHNRPNGLNINDQCGSEHTEDLRKLVVESGSIIGLAFDGDADRLIAVDEKGNEISGDQIMNICARQLKREEKLKNNLLVGTVMSNLGLKLACKQAGIDFHAANVGDRYVLEAMKQLGAVIGGEDSGHMLFLDHHTAGDGIITALQLIATILKTGQPLSALAAEMEILPQRLINVDVKHKPEISSIPTIVEAIAAVEAELSDEGRVLVRYSGTQNMCRVMVEGPNREVTDLHCEALAEVVRKTLG
jgi:phosphoglucosamine mutase